VKSAFHCTVVTKYSIRIYRISGHFHSPDLAPAPTKLMTDTGYLSWIDILQAIRYMTSGWIRLNNLYIDCSLCGPTSHTVVQTSAL